jgi:hypothetical protein
MVQKFSINVLGIQFNPMKAFNGIRFRKVRRI